MEEQKAGEELVRVIVRPGRTLVFGLPNGIRRTYRAGVEADLPATEAARLEKAGVVNLREE